MSDATTTSLADGARQLETLDRLSVRFGQSLQGALSAGTTSGRTLSGVLDGIAAALASGLGSTAKSVLGESLTGAARSLSESAAAASFGAGLLPFATGGVLSGSRVVPFASGGIVSAPTYFPLAGGTGLAGEAGPEAIVPLARGPDGRLGIRGGGGGGPVTVNITTPDADSFRRSEAQVSAALARAVARGRRAS